MRRVWPDAVVEENNLTVNISALRKSLGEGPREHRYLVTVSGRGYQFVADVQQHVGERAGKSDAEAPANQRVAEVIPELVRDGVGEHLSFNHATLDWDQRGLWSRSQMAPRARFIRHRVRNPALARSSGTSMARWRFWRLCSRQQ